MPEFSGTVDSVEAFEWLDAMEEAIAMFTMTNWEKVRYVTSLLRGDAKAWWRLVCTTCLVEGMAWTDFIQAFNEEY